MRLNTIIIKYFRGIDPPKVKKYLLAIQHPHTTQEVLVQLGPNAGQIKTMRDYTEHGLKNAYLDLISTSIKIADQSKKFKMHHKVIGDYTILKRRIPQDVIDFISNKPIGACNE